MTSDRRDSSTVPFLFQEGNLQSCYCLKDGKSNQDSPRVNDSFKLSAIINSAFDCLIDIGNPEIFFQIFGVSFKKCTKPCDIIPLVKQGIKSIVLFSVISYRPKPVVFCYIIESNSLLF